MEDKLKDAEADANMTDAAQGEGMAATKSFNFWECSSLSIDFWDIAESRACDAHYTHANLALWAQ